MPPDSGDTITDHGYTSEWTRLPASPPPDPRRFFESIASARRPRFRSAREALRERHDGDAAQTIAQPTSR